MKLAPPTRKSLKVDVASVTTTYIGEAAFNTATSSPTWRINRIETLGSVTTITWADGDDEFNNVWDDRASLSYS